MSNKISELSFFLRMDPKKVLKKARIAALPRQALYWSLISPVIFIILLFFEAKFEIQGLGNTIKMALKLSDMPLFYGSSACAAIFVVIVNIFFLTLKQILPHR